MRKIIFMVAILFSFHGHAADEFSHDAGFLVGAGPATPVAAASHDGSRSFTGEGYAAALMGFYKADFVSWFSLRPAIGFSSKGLVEDGAGGRRVSSLVSLRTELSFLFVIPADPLRVSIGFGPFVDVSFYRHNTSADENNSFVLLGGANTPLATFGPLVFVGVSWEKERINYGGELRVEIGNAIEMYAEHAIFLASILAMFTMSFDL